MNQQQDNPNPKALLQRIAEMEQKINPQQNQIQRLKAEY